MFTIKLVLQNAAGAARADEPLEVYALDFEGRDRLIGKGVSNREGTVAISIDDSGVGKVVPQLQVRSTGKPPTVIADTPTSIAGGVVDFGTVKPKLTVPTSPQPPIAPPIISPTVPPSVSAVRSTSMEELLTSVSAQLSRAKTTLDSNNTAFRFSNVSLQLKLIPATDGTVSLPTHELVDKIANPLSVLNVDFQPAPSTDDASMLVPNVVGYTETVAVRKLTSSGLRAVTTRQTVSDDPSRPSSVGRVVAQDPPANSRLEAGAQVAIAIGVPL